MSIEINGVILPDIPADILAEYPYAVICAGPTHSYSTFGLGLSKGAWCYVHSDVSGLDMSILYAQSEHKAYSLESDGSGWIEGSEDLDSFFMNKVAPEWCNHDIYKAATFDQSTFEITIGTELYYTERQNFNGVWLPKIPEGFFDTNSYGYIIKYVADTTTYYYLFDSSSELLHGSTEIAKLIGMSSYNGSDGLVMTLGDTLNKHYCAGLCGVWQNTNASFNPCPMGQFNEYNFQLIWTNHDVLDVTSVNTDTGDYTTDDIYFLDCTVTFKEKYTAPSTWFIGMADQIRRIGQAAGYGSKNKYTINNMKTVLDEIVEVKKSNTASIVFDSLGPLVELGPECAAAIIRIGNRWIYPLANGNIAYSYDFKTWDVCTVTPDATPINNMDYKDDMYICCGQNGPIMYSTDCINWTASTNMTSANISCFEYANNVWCAADTSNGIYYSTDRGVTWTQSNMTVPMKSIKYNDGIWIAGGVDSGYYYSEDGITWTQSNITNSDEPISEWIYYVNGLWIVQDASKNTYYSEDGKTWTQSGCKDIRDIKYYNNIYLAVFANDIYYSEDGKTWTKGTVPETDVYFDSGLNAIQYFKGLWIIGSTGEGSGIYYSEDGKTWTRSDFTKPVGGLSGIVCGENLIVVSSMEITPNIKDGNIFYEITANGIWTSLDGITWTQTNVYNTSYCYTYYNDGVWIMLASTASGTYTLEESIMVAMGTDFNVFRYTSIDRLK